MHEVYGIDVGDDDLMESRSWRWLQARIAGLMSRPPVYVSYALGERVAAVATTRLGYALNPPDFGT